MKVQISIAIKSFEAKQLSGLERAGSPSQVTTSTHYEKDLSARQTSAASVVVPDGPLSYSGYKGLKGEGAKLARPTNYSLVSVALPKTGSNYTVLRSPHIDKKSRDQFELRIYKQLILISTEIDQIREKLFRLKFHEMPGIQMKVVFQTKTRLNCQNGGGGDSRLLPKDPGGALFQSPSTVVPEGR